VQIRLRPSGGRGEYELAGSHGSIRVSDLYGLALWIDFGLELHVPLYAIANTHDGKPRIRLNDQRANAHAARLIAAVLLLPEPIREIRKTGTASVLELHDCAYSSIVVDVVAKTRSLATLRPRTVVAINAVGASVGIDVLARFEQVQGLWLSASAATSLLDVALSAHRAACTAQPFIHKDVLVASRRVMELLGNADQDGLPAAVLDAEEVEIERQPVVPAEDDTSNPIQVNRDIRKRLVWRAERGAEGRRFKNLVNQAYGYKCAFSGLRLPPLEPGYLPGVDAAHIYPWSQLGSNEITNGICLSKQMHWAFDEGILKLTCDQKAFTYLIGLGDDVSQLATAVDFDLEPFVKVCGPIPEDRLPQERLLRPSVKAIELYNALMFPSL
jgi:HNH endonuclease